MTCRSLVPLVEPKLRSTEVGLIRLTSKNTLRILNTIKPVTNVFTAMEVAKAVNASANHAIEVVVYEGGLGGSRSNARQVASRGDKLKSASSYQIMMKID